ncbi:hypothetical protein JXA27_07010 [Aerococcaceae bacterium zg-B36]|uniref:hypothetical protein n=1 Tax=Aerococcaceae bacterium zg-252 TaxID=2796928 RepID=UPI001BD86348|nr:hypothetical protein [Aerococcaceae bacterium zg-B36]
MAKKNFVRLDKVSKEAHYETVVSKSDELIAGQLINLGKVVKVSEGEAVDFEKATADKGFDAIVVPVYLDKGYIDFNILTQSVPAGKVTRALIPEKGAIISINKELCGEFKAGDNVTTNANGLGFKKVTAAETVVGKCIAVETLAGVGELYVIRFA